MKITKNQLKSWGIKAGRGIEAGGGIEAGEGMGIFAGLRKALPTWALYAQVIASAKPANLVSGAWVDPEKDIEEGAI